MRTWQAQDTVQRIQVGEREFTDLNTFVKTNRLKAVRFDEAKVKHRYTVIVFTNGVVLKCFVTGVFKRNSFRVMESNRGERRREIYRDECFTIYQDLLNAEI